MWDGAGGMKLTDEPTPYFKANETGKFEKDKGPKKNLAKAALPAATASASVPMDTTVGGKRPILSSVFNPIAILDLGGKKDFQVRSHLRSDHPGPTSREREPTLDGRLLSGGT